MRLATALYVHRKAGRFRRRAGAALSR